MGRMPHPVMELVQGAWVADRIDEQFEKIGMKSVIVSQGLARPSGQSRRGGVTKVPFVTWWSQGRAEALIQAGASPIWRGLTPGTCLLVAPGTYIEIRHRGPGAYLRGTLDTDHLLVGRARVARAEDPDDLSDWLPLQAAVLSQRALPDLLWRALDPTVSTPHRLALLSAWWWELSSSLRRERSPGRAQATWSAMRVWLEDHAARGVSRDEVARAFGVHPQHVSRLFARFAGEGFARTSLRARLDQACEHLATGGASIAAIASTCGFSSPSHFVRRFREAHGCTPAVWRRARK